MTYKRVLPRDAFNEAKLLKCIGKLTLMIEDDELPAWHYHYDEEPFNIVQDASDGSISVANISFWRNKKQINVSTPLNSKDVWPAIGRVGDDEYYLFSEQGQIHASSIERNNHTMTNTQHTPGPWEILDNQKISAKSRTIVIADLGRPIPERFKVAHDEYEANARLIAAAHDYFDGCKDLPQIIDGESTTDYDKRVLAWFYSNAGKIHSANNKAKGE